MRVLLDGMQLTGQAASSGIGTYVRSLLASLAELDDLEVAVLATPEAVLPANVAHVPVRRRWRHGRRAEWEHLLLQPAAMWRSDAEVRHVPHAPVPPLQPSPWVATLLDVAPLVVDDPHLRHLRRHIRRLGTRLRRAAEVIAISQFTADSGVRHLGLDPAHTHVIHLGVGAAFRPDGAAVDASRPYLLVVSEYQRRKGFDRAFAVIDELAERGRPHTLKVAGRLNPWDREELAGLVASLRHPARVELLGYVDDLPALYRGAEVVLVPSRYEGFGLPAVEAMACGRPVVSFDNSSLGEVIAEGGLLVADGDADAMLRATLSLLDSPTRRDELGEVALARARRFTWAASAAAHAEVYRAAAERAR